MNRSISKIIFIVSSLSLMACNRNQETFDASGAFEAVETIISSETNGKILSLQLNEGDELKEGQIIGFIDSTQLCLTRDLLMQNQRAVLSGKPDIRTQIDALQKELDNAVTDRNRIANLVKGDVASQKQLDDADARVATIKAKITAQRNALQTSSNAITEQGNAVEAQLNQINDQIRKCTLVNPLNGTVLTKYAEPNEMTVIGKPLYKIADLKYMVLRIYITGNQLPGIQLNQQVKVLTDDGKGGFKESPGTISWISSKAEFTPKTIQTKEERANMVYAVKVNVVNDGTFKIGMYGEVKFN